jgi:hypothetical protein
MAIQYNEALDPATVNATNVTMTGPNGGGTTKVLVSLDSTGMVILVTPVDNNNNRITLQGPGVYYYFGTTTGIHSASGVAQQNTTSWYFYTGSASDTTSPTVSAVTPPDTATNVGDNASIVVRFSKAVDPLTVNGNTIQVTGGGTTVVNGSISFANQNRDVFIVPQATLPDSTQMTIAISGVTDVSGNAVVAKTTTFTTSNGPDLVAPSVIAENPLNGAGNVPTNVAISLLANEPVDPSTVNSATFQVYDNFVGQQVSGSYSVSSDGRMISFVPNAPLGVNRSHSVYFASQGITDLEGNLLNGGVLSNFSFTTGSTADTTGPQVKGISPPDGLTGVPLNAQVMIDFDKPINTLTGNLITLTTGGQAANVITGFTNGDSRVVLTSVVPLTASTQYTVTVGAVKDLSGIALATPFITSFTTTTGVALIGPTITVVSPGNGAAGVPTNAVVQIGFSERIDALTVNSGTFVVYPQATGIPIGGTYGVSGDGLSATFTPSAPLQPSTGYSISVSGVADLVGQQTSVFTNFTTGVGTQTAALTVVAVSPPNGSVGVPLNAYVAVRLSAPVSPVTVGSSAITLSANGSNVAGAIAISADRQTVTLTPSSQLAANTGYTVTLGSFADVAGNLAAPFTSGFTTGTTTVGPGALSVSSIVPGNGSTNVPVNSTVVVTFNETINPSTVSVNTLTVYQNGVANLAGSYQVNGTTVTFTPLSPFPGNTQIGVQVSGVQDLAGNGNNYVNITFRTSAVADTTPPTVISVTPSNGTAGVGLNAQVVMTFSKSLNPGTVNNNTFALFANGSRFGYVSGVSADNRTVTLYGGTLPASTVVTVAATGAVQDLSGNHLADFTSEFMTVPAPDTGHASVVGQRPGNGASGVPVSSKIVLFVNEALNASTVNGALHITQNGVVVNGTVQVTGNGQVIQFQPTSGLQSNALVQVFLDSTAVDTDGNTVNGYQASFRTALDPLTTPPVPVALSPVYGAQNVPLNPVMAIQYNEALDPATVNATNVTMTGPNGGGTTKVLVSLDSTGMVILSRRWTTTTTGSLCRGRGCTTTSGRPRGSTVRAGWHNRTPLPGTSTPGRRATQRVRRCRQ